MQCSQFPKHLMSLLKPGRHAALPIIWYKPSQNKKNQNACMKFFLLVTRFVPVKKKLAWSFFVGDTFRPSEKKLAWSFFVGDTFRPSEKKLAWSFFVGDTFRPSEKKTCIEFFCW